MITEDIQEITLEFNTDIIYGNASLFDESSSQVDEKTIVVRKDGPLESGNYTVK